MKFSVRVNNDLSFDELLAVAVSAESAGFHQVWVSNDLFMRSAPALIGAVAAHTTTIGLGIAVMNPYSVHVGELAMAAATLQEISGGRFLLGLGAGSEQFLGWAGIARPHPLAATRSALVALRALLGHDDVDAAQLPGWFGAQSVLRFDVRTPVPVYVGAMGPKMLEMAGRHADGALPLLYPPELYANARSHVLAGTTHANRNFDLPACFWVSVSDDPAAARTALAEKLAYYGPSISGPMLASAGLSPQDFTAAANLAHAGRAAAQLINDRMLALGIAGDANEVRTRCEALSRLGARHLSFGPPLGPDPVTAIRILGSEVLPALSEFSREPA